MAFPNTGFFWDEPEMISCIIIADEVDGVHTAVYQPTENEVKKLAEEYKFDWDVLRNLIYRSDPKAHTLFIEVNKFRAYCEELANGPTSPSVGV